MAEPAVKPVPPGNDNAGASDMEKLAELVGQDVAQLHAIIAQLTAEVAQLKSAPAPEIPQPVVNVAPSTAAVNVQASEVSPTFSPQITVPPAQVIANPEINLSADALNVSLQVNELVAAITASSKETADGLKAQAGAISQIATSLNALAAAFTLVGKQLSDQADQHAAASDNQVRAIEGMARALTAPRSLVLDANGQPTGIVVDRKLQ